MLCSPETVVVVVYSWPSASACQSQSVRSTFLTVHMIVEHPNEEGDT